MTISFLQLVELFKASASGIAIALALSPLAIWIAKRVGLIDLPGSAMHKQHAWPTPLAGGIVLVVCAVVLMTIFNLWQPPFSALAAATAIVFVFGLWDDAKGLSAPQKLIGQVLASVLLIASGASVKFLENFSIPFLNPNIVTLLNWGLTIFWMVGIANSINLIDSMDGLALGVTGIAFAFFMVMALVAQQSSLAVFSALFLGICIGLYVFNITPARLFLGDSGAQTLGFILAAVAMIYAPDNLPQGSSWFAPIMILGFPIFDTTLVVVSRVRRRKPVFQADATHTFHRLLKCGLDSKRAVLAIHLTTLALNLLAFIALSRPPFQAFLIFCLVVFTGFLLLIYFERRNSSAEKENGK